MRYVQAALDTCTVGLLYSLGRALAPGVGLMAAAIAAFYAPMIYYIGLLDKTTLTLFLSSLSLALFSCAMEQKNYRWFIASGAALALSALTRGHFLIVGVGLCIWLAIYGPAIHRSRMGASAALLTGLLSIIGPVCLRNYIVGKEFVLVTSNVGLNLAIGNNPAGSGAYVEPPFIRGIPEHEFADSKAFAESQTGRNFQQAADVSSYFTHLALSFIFREPSLWIRLMGKKLFLFANSLEIPETYSFNYFRDKYPAILGMTLSFGILAPLGICGLIALGRRPSTIWLVIVGAIYALSVISFFVTSRYRIPIVLILIPCAAYYLANLRQSTLPDFIKLTWPLIPLWVLCNWQPQWLKGRIARSDRSTPHTLAGNILYQNGQIHQAVIEFEKARSLMPEFGSNYLYLSQCYAKLGQSDKVIESLEAAIRVNPMLDAAYANLAVEFADRKDYPRAAAALSYALRLKPYDPIYRRNHDKLLALMGRRTR
ncbi:MAG: tetratricopeptide repeat protein [Elusimicrobiota bacterium]|nr:MAG: tetratricopeptide repeat protein [Elusimicrobiota bacterium]